MVRLALIGCGKHMQTTLLPYLMRLEGYEVEVCVDLDEDAVRRVQHMSHAKSWAYQVEDIDINDIDAALIAVPGNKVYSITHYLLHHNISCFVEKPPASTTQEVDDLLRIAHARNIYVQVGFNFRYAEAIDELHSRIIAHA